MNSSYSRVTRSDLEMIRKSGNHSQISKYFRVSYIKIDEGEGCLEDILDSSVLENICSNYFLLFLFGTCM